MATSAAHFEGNTVSSGKTRKIETLSRYALLKAMLVALAFTATFDASAAVGVPLLYGDTNVCAGTRGLTYTATGFGATSYFWNLVDNTSGAVFSPVPSPTDTIVHASAGPSGGSFRVELTVTGGVASGETFYWKTIISPLPPVTVSPNVAICAGTSATLTASGADAYSWSPATGLSATTGSSVTASPVATTVYTVTGFGSDSCESSATVTVTVNGSIITCPPNYTNTVWSLYTNMASSLVCGYTQGAWSTHPHGNNPGSILNNYFGAVYRSGYVEAGVIGGAGYSMKFTSPAAIQAYLPAGSTPGALNADLVNPTTASAGSFGGQVLSLQLNVDFSDAGFTVSPGASLGNLVLKNSAPLLKGKSVRQILAIANTALGGGDISGYGMTISSLNTLVSDLNLAFEGCQADSWAQANLVSLVLPTPAQSGSPTLTDSCGSSPSGSVSYTDSVAPVAGSGGYLVTRTWQVVDSSGATNSCAQILALGQ